MKSGCQLPSQKLISTQSFETKDFILHDTFNEDTESRQSSDSKFLYEKWSFLCVDEEELCLRELLTEQFEVFVHYFASLELLVIKMDDCSFEFSHVA